MGRGAGVVFDVTLDSFELDLKNAGPEWVKKTDLGVKIGKKKEFGDSIAVPIKSVKMTEAYDSATVKSYDDEAPIGYLLISPESISEAINEEIHALKKRYHPGIKVKDLGLHVHSLPQLTYSGGWKRSPFPANGMFDTDNLDLTVDFYVVDKDGKTLRGDAFSLEDVEGSLFFPKHGAVHDAYNGLGVEDDDLEDEDE